MDGFVRVKIDGAMRDLAEDITLNKDRKHTIEVVVDRLVVKAGIERRLRGTHGNHRAHGRRHSHGGSSGRRTTCLQRKIRMS